MVTAPKAEHDQTKTLTPHHQPVQSPANAFIRLTQRRSTGAALGGNPLEAWTPTDIRIVDSCNFRILLTIERQFIFVVLASAAAAYLYRLGHRKRFRLSD